jgi:glycosyltransferase involved in cell wall biosynthesis
MKVVVPFYPLYVPTEKEDYFKICADAGNGAVFNLAGHSFWETLKTAWSSPVHAHGRGWPFPEGLPFFGGRMIYSFHNNFIGKKKTAIWVRRFLFNRCLAVIVQTEFAKNNYVKQGIDPSKIRLIPHAIDFPYFSKPRNGAAFRKRMGLGPDEPFAFCVGIRWFKNPGVIIDGCRKAGIRLVMAGFKNSGDTWKGYEWLMPSLSLEDAEKKGCILAGHLNAEDLLSAYDSATVFVNSSENDGENFGIAVYEAAAAGKALCLPDFGGFDIFKSCARFHPNHDSDKLSNNIRYFVDHPEERKIYGLKAREIAAKFDYPIILNRLKNFYRELGILPK